jgi:hypothetical protein
MRRRECWLFQLPHPFTRKRSSVTSPFLLSRVAKLLVVAACVFGLPGCGGPPTADYSKVDLLSVDGTVTLDGNSLADAVILFENPVTATFSYALTDASGGYKLRFDSVKIGCTPGPKVVRVSTTMKIPGLNGEEGGGEEEGVGEESEDGGESPSSASRGEQVPSRYNRESELRVEVGPGSQQFDFDLKTT